MLICSNTLKCFSSLNQMYVFLGQHYMEQFYGMCHCINMQESKMKDKMQDTIPGRVYYLPQLLYILILIHIFFNNFQNEKKVLLVLLEKVVQKRKEKVCN